MRLGAGGLENWNLTLVMRLYRSDFPFDNTLTLWFPVWVNDHLFLLLSVKEKKKKMCAGTFTQAFVFTGSASIFGFCVVSPLSWLFQFVSGIVREGCPPISYPMIKKYFSLSKWCFSSSKVAMITVMNNCDFIVPLIYFNKNLEQRGLCFKIAWFVILFKKISFRVDW